MSFLGMYIATISSYRSNLIDLICLHGRTSVCVHA